MPVRVLAPKRKSAFTYVGTKLDIPKHPCTLSLWRELPRLAMWNSLPESGFPKAPPRYHQLIRGVCNNFGDMLVKVRGSRVKVWF
jgi:hypothetical protein